HRSRSRTRHCRRRAGRDSRRSSGPGGLSRDRLRGPSCQRRARQFQALGLSDRQPTRDDTVIVKQIWTANAYRNFNYLIACSETGEALAVDPLDYEKCLKAAKDEGWDITQILNTHEHRDHTGGNEP